MPSDQPITPPDSEHALKTRSCDSCAGRKIKCDRTDPCLNCRKHGTQCVFAPPGRARRKAKQGAYKKDLQRRLEQMEHTLLKMREKNVQQSTSNAQPITPASEYTSPKSESLIDIDSIKFTGRINVDQGQKHYVGDDSMLWQAIMDEMDGLKRLIVFEKGETDPEALTENATNHQGFMFGFRSLALDMRSFHPEPPHIEVYWQTYMENVDPLVKIGHALSFTPQIVTAMEDPGRLSRPTEAAIFAVYYSAVVSMTCDEVIESFGETKPALLDRYRFATEQALARANFLSSRNATTLQAFALFLIMSPYSYDAGLARNLTGILVRSAQSAGLHRETSCKAVCPFGSEMRRRLWWNIWCLDFRTSEDHGSDPQSTEMDMALPLNLNDSDLHPNMACIPKASKLPSDSTLSLIRFELCRMLSRMDLKTVRTSGSISAAMNRQLKGLAALIEETEERINTIFTETCAAVMCRIDCRLAGTTLMRIMKNKAWFLVYHPLRLADQGISLPLDITCRLFRKAMDSLECARIFETTPCIRKWAWVSRTYIQWHAIAILISGICYPHDTMVAARAWCLLLGVFQEWGNDPDEQRTGLLWSPMRKLRTRARIAWEKKHGRTVDDLLESTHELRTAAWQWEDDPIFQPLESTVNSQPFIQPTTSKMNSHSIRGLEPPEGQQQIPFHLPTGNITTSTIGEPKVHPGFQFMPMMFDLVDSSASGDMLDIDSAIWNEAEQYFDFGFNSQGQIQPDMNW